MFKKLKQKAKAIEVQGGRFAPLLVYGDLNNSTASQPLTAKKAIEFYDKTGQILVDGMSINETPFMVGDYVTILEGGVESMGNYWMKNDSRRTWRITQMPKKYAGGICYSTALGGEHDGEGALPNVKYLRPATGSEIAMRGDIKVVSKFRVGNSVQISPEGLEWMRLNGNAYYWIDATGLRTFTITEFFSSGTRCKCREGVLPPNKYLILIGSSFDKGSDSLSKTVPPPRDLRDDDYIDLIINRMNDEYGDDGTSIDELRKTIKEAFKYQGSYLHALDVEAPNYNFTVIAEGQAKQYLIDHFTDADPYYLGGWNDKVFEECYPEKLSIFKALQSSESYEEIGDMILGLDNGTGRLVNYLVDKYGIQQTVADHLSYYDNKALKFVYYGNTYYIVRTD